MAILTMDTHEGAGPGRAEVFVEYVPDQICVVVTVENQDILRDLGALYSDVRTWLNDRIAEALADTLDAEAQDPGMRMLCEQRLHADLLDRYKAEPPTKRLFDLEPRLKPEKLQQFFLERPMMRLTEGTTLQRSDIQLLEKLDVSSLRESWTFLRGVEGGSASLLLFYKITSNDGLLRPGLSDLNLRDQLDRVRELTNLINLNVLGRAPQPVNGDSSGCTVDAAHPNWLVSGSQSEGGSPGARPEPEGPGDWNFVFKNRKLQDLVEETDDSKVLVAVLDTSPEKEQVINAAWDCLTDNRLLQKLSDELQGSPPNFIIDYRDGDFGLKRLLTDWGDQQPTPNDTDYKPYEMPDHGLFVAGIIRSIAPKARIRLIRVLNDYCIGTMRVITQTLAELPGILEEARAEDDTFKHLVVNMSLGFDIPPGEDLLEIWYPELYKLLTGSDTTNPRAGAVGHATRNVLVALKAGKNLAGNFEITLKLISDVLGALLGNGGDSHVLKVEQALNVLESRGENAEDTWKKLSEVLDIPGEIADDQKSTQLLGALEALKALRANVDDQSREHLQDLKLLVDTVAGLLNSSHDGLRRTIQWLYEQGFLVVAAAGNDYDPRDPRVQKRYQNLNQPAPRPEPRYPAHYDEVMGVGAISVGGRPSKFSNRGDEKGVEFPGIDPGVGALTPNGIATFGGDATRPRAGALPIIGPGDVGIVGVYSAPALPLLPERKNPHRWVRWAGTSFSTPIISAIAAKLWSYWETKAGDALGPDSLIKNIASIGEHTPTVDGEISAPGILVKQVQ